MNRRISVIIPCLNDADELAACLKRLSSCGPGLEIIVADASTGDDSARIAVEVGAILVRCSRPGRGFQLNSGAAAATGDVLIFNHADTQLGPEHLAALRVALLDDELTGGAFHRDVAWQYPVFAPAANFSRAYNRRFGILYGDQSIFVRRETFETIGRFADIPILEDVEFSRRLRQAGRIAFLDPPLRASVRRFEQRGYLRNKVQNVLIIWIWRLGLATPDQVYMWYYGKPVDGQAEP